MHAHILGNMKERGQTTEVHPYTSGEDASLRQLASCTGVNQNIVGFKIVVRLAEVSIHSRPWNRNQH